MTELSQKPVRYIIDSKDTSSEAAQIYFVHQEGTDDQIVLKVLRRCKNRRYPLHYPKQRRACQIEALRYNRLFTPEIYRGIAQLHEPIREFSESISLGAIIAEPDEAQVMNARGKDFVLVMNCLPLGRRLDVLLREANEIVRDTLIESLVERIVFIHSHLSPELEDGNWGNLSNLKKKFKHNIHLFEDARQKLDADELYLSYKPAYDPFKSILNDFYAALNTYSESFEKRVKEHRIKRCHGDLKSTNIWVMPYDYILDQKQHRNVKILDTIDFNAMYSNIDVLSDLAMLAVDIYVIVKEYRCIDRLLKAYLEKTHQQDRDAWNVLYYYLFEKSVVCAALSIIDEHNPERGQLCLDYARHWLMKLPLSFKLENGVNELTKIL